MGNLLATAELKRRRAITLDRLARRTNCLRSWAGDYQLVEQLEKLDGMMATCLALSCPGRKAERSMAMVSTQNSREYCRHQWLTTCTSVGYTARQRAE